MQRMRLVQSPYKIGGDNIVMGGHRYQNLEQHILWDLELLARRRRRARVFARQVSWQSGVLQRQYTGRRTRGLLRRTGCKLTGWYC